MSRKSAKAIICIPVLVVGCSFAFAAYPIVVSGIQTLLNTPFDDGSFARQHQRHAHRKWLILQQKKWEDYQRRQHQKQGSSSGVSK